jgi:lipopolysaccharide export system permease protein
MASFCFVLVGIPLGIKAQRKESTIGMAIALAVSLGYYLIVILMLSLHKNFVIHPEYLIWLAVVICLGLASRLIPKNL